MSGMTGGWRLFFPISAGVATTVAISIQNPTAGIALSSVILVAASHFFRKKVLRNRSRAFVCRPRMFFEPKTEEQLIFCVKSAFDEGLKIRAVGSLSAFSNCGMCDGVIISMRQMNKIVSFEPNLGEVTVQVAKHFFMHIIGFHCSRPE